MPTKAPKRRPATARLYRETAYLHADEAEALSKRAAKERTSRSEIIRRAIRAYLGIED